MSEVKTSAQIAKDRLLNLKGGAVEIKEGDRYLVDPSTGKAEKLDSVYTEPVVSGSIAATLAQRGSRYGDFTDHAKICQDIMKVMMRAQTKDSEGTMFEAWMKLDPVKRQALTVIADKIARILSGDPNYDDNWHDIQGYAKLVEDRLPKAKESK